MFIAPVVKWISLLSSEQSLRVRILPGAQWRSFVPRDLHFYADHAGFEILEYILFPRGEGIGYERSTVPVGKGSCHLKKC